MRTTFAAAAALLALAFFAAAALAQSAGTVPNAPSPGSAAAPAPEASEPEVPAARAPAPAAPHADTAVKQQAQAKRREALEHCQAMTGESRSDCVRRADAEYRRATSDDTLSGERAPGASLG